MARTALQIAGTRPIPRRNVHAAPRVPTPPEEITRSKLAQEEAALAEMIQNLILDGQWEILQPNSGESVAVGEHHVCVGYEEEAGTGYRTWEWHGHILVYDEEHGYTPEYIYGSYLEKVNQYENFLGRPSVGLGEIISGIERRALIKRM